jgi:ubiquinone biosynthesis protein
LLNSLEPVVVKVRRPGICETVEQDLSIVDRFARRADSSINAARLLQLRPVADELAWSLRRELDMRCDASNAHQIATILQRFDRIRVPRIHDELVTERVLVMQRLDGHRLDDRDVQQQMTPAMRRELADQLLHAFIHMVLVEGVYHADPHA